MVSDTKGSKSQVFEKKGALSSRQHIDRKIDIRSCTGCNTQKYANKNPVLNKTVLENAKGFCTTAMVDLLSIRLQNVVTRKGFEIKLFENFCRLNLGV